MNKVTNDLETLLGSYSRNKPHCLFIDQIDRISVDQEKRQEFEEVLFQVQQYNEHLIANGANERDCWRVVVTCREDEYEKVNEIHFWKQSFAPSQIAIYSVSQIADNELDLLTATFPQLESLLKKERIHPILHRPFYLDLFLRYPSLRDEVAIGSTLSETHFLEAFWKTVIRDKSQYGGERLMHELAKSLLKSGDLNVPTRLLELQLLDPLPTLISEQILIEESDRIRFRHAIFKEWSTAKLLGAYWDDLSEFAQSVAYPYDLLRPLQLCLTNKLSLQNDVSGWFAFLDQQWTSGAITDLAVKAFLESPNLESNLREAQGRIFSNDSDLLMQMLRILRTDCTQPSASMEDLLSVFRDSVQKQQMINLTREPIPTIWQPMIVFIIGFQAQLPILAFPELAEIFHSWIKTGLSFMRKEVAELSLSFLGMQFDDELDDLIYGEDANVTCESHVGWVSEQTRRTLTMSVLFSADVIPKQLAQFINQSLEQNRENEVRRVLFQGANWAKMLIHTPDLLFEAAEKILCWKPTPEQENKQYQQRCNSFFRTAIQDGDQHWVPATSTTGPFYYLLKARPEFGLRLLHLIVNHETDFWKRCCELSNATPISQTIQLADKSVEVWGNHQIYIWSRPGNVSHAVQCALRALEKWLYEQVEESESNQIIEIFSHILSGTNSIAIPCVLLSVTLKYPRKCVEAVLPILTCPAIWEVDPYRFENEANVLLAFNMIASKLNEVQRKNLYKWETAPHRESVIDDLANWILLNGSASEKQFLSEAMRSFPTRLPFFTSVELNMPSVKLQREKRFNEIALWSDPAQQMLEELQSVSNGIGIESAFPNPPTDSKVELSKQLHEFILWAKALRDTGNVESGYSLIQGVELSKQLLDNHNSLVETDAELSLRILEGVGYFAAGLVAHQNQWLAVCRRREVVRPKAKVV